MRYLLIVLFAAVTFSFGQEAGSRSRTFGAGLIIGEPTGITMKLWTAPENAFDFGIGWSVGGDRIGRFDNYYYGENRMHIHADYLWHAFDVFRGADLYPVYYGIGMRINTGDNTNASLAVRGVLGIAWMPRSTPIDVFMELVPMLQLTSSTGFGVDAAVGIRYYF